LEDANQPKGLGGKEPSHPSFQQIALVDMDTGELSERRLGHREQAEQFYREQKQQSLGVRVGMESSGHSRWFEGLLRELQFELWIGDAAEIRTKRVRKQKTDRQDAQLLLRLLLENRFPRIWVPDAANRDLRQPLWHRHRLVQMRTQMMNQLQVVALNEGLQSAIFTGSIKRFCRNFNKRSSLLNSGAAVMPEEKELNNVVKRGSKPVDWPARSSQTQSDVRSRSRRKSAPLIRL